MTYYFIFNKTVYDLHNILNICLSMMMENKAKSIFSSLTAILLVIFLMASTSHMGISHHLYIPGNPSSQINLAENNQNDNKDCPWAYATLMTSGDNPPIELSFTIESDHYFFVIQSQFYLSDTSTTSDPRGPPAIFS